MTNTYCWTRGSTEQEFNTLQKGSLSQDSTYGGAAGARSGNIGLQKSHELDD